MHKLRKNNHHCGDYTVRVFQNITRKIITNNVLLSLTDNNRYYCSNSISISRNHL